MLPHAHTTHLRLVLLLATSDMDEAPLPRPSELMVRLIVAIGVWASFSLFFLLVIFVLGYWMAKTFMLDTFSIGFVLAFVLACSVAFILIRILVRILRANFSTIFNDFSLSLSRWFYESTLQPPSVIQTRRPSFLFILAAILCISGFALIIYVFGWFMFFESPAPMLRALSYLQFECAVPLLLFWALLCCGYFVYRILRGRPITRNLVDNIIKMIMFFLFFTSLGFFMNADLLKCVEYGGHNVPGLLWPMNPMVHCEDATGNELVIP